MQLVQGEGRRFRLIALYGARVEPPDLSAVPGVLGCLWNVRATDQLAGARVPALEAVLEVRCEHRDALEVAAQRVGTSTRPLAMLATREHVILERQVTSDSVKGIFLFRRRGNLEVQAFQSYWLEHHGPIAGRTPSALRYVQCHVLPESYATGRPTYDGVTEIYWPSFDRMVESMGSPSMTVEQAGDAPNFVAPGSVELLVVREYQR